MPSQLELDAERALRRETQQEALRNRSVCYCRAHVDAPASAHRPSPPTLPTLLGVSCFVGAWDAPDQARGGSCLLSGRHQAAAQMHRGARGADV